MKISCMDTVLGYCKEIERDQSLGIQFRYGRYFSPKRFAQGYCTIVTQHLDFFSPIRRFHCCGEREGVINE